MQRINGEEEYDSQSIEEYSVRKRAGKENAQQILNEIIVDI